MHSQWHYTHQHCVVCFAVHGPGEYLFAPYSVFKLVSVEWSSKISASHTLVLEVAVDNRLEEETLPLAPWY